jgi:hypothetical protein
MLVCSLLLLMVFLWCLGVGIYSWSLMEWWEEMVVLGFMQS